MLGSVIDRFRPDPLRARVEAAIRRGTGLSRSEWLLDSAPVTEGDLQRLSDDVLEWCRERMAASRRPYGVDQMALALACAVPGGEPISSATFGVFRPVEFYAAEGISEQVDDYLNTLPLGVLNQRAAQIRVAAALFSWGDVALETLFRER